MKLLPIAAAVAALLAGCRGGGDEERRRPGDPRQELVVQDDALLLYRPDREVRRTVSIMRSLGVDRVRITAGWGVIAPDVENPRRPSFDATDPDAYPPAGWRNLDRAVAEVQRQGLEVMIDVGFWAPRWAVERSTGAPDELRWRPDPREFGQFAEAVARRYPSVRLWTTWNEPNHVQFLLPQWERRGRDWVPAAAHHYRAMHESGYAAIKRASRDNRVLIGGLSSFGSGRPGAFRSIRPLRFVRDLACVDGRLRPLRLPDCRGFRPLRADGFAHHPYMHKLPPDRPLPDPDSAGLADLDRLASLLDDLHARGRIASRLPLYVTEFGYETNPPDPERGVALGTQALWLNQAATIALRQPRVRMFSQFLLRDVPEDRIYQTGLILPEGRPKPSLVGFRLPFWIDGLDATGQVRPADGRERVRLEFRGRNGSWRPAGPAFGSDANGVVRRRVGRPGTYRLRWGRERSLPAATNPRLRGGG